MVVLGSLLRKTETVLKIHAEPGTVLLQGIRDVILKNGKR